MVSVSWTPIITFSASGGLGFFSAIVCPVLLHAGLPEKKQKEVWTLLMKNSKFDRA